MKVVKLKLKINSLELTLDERIMRFEITNEKISDKYGNNMIHLRIHNFRNNF